MPSSVAGTVTEVKVKAGDKVKVGQAILSVDDGARRGRAAQPAPAAAPSRSRAPKAAGAEGAAGRADGRQPRRRKPRRRSPRPSAAPRPAAANVVDISRGAAAGRRRRARTRRPRPRRRRCAAWRASSASTSTTCRAPGRTAASRSRTCKAHAKRLVTRGAGAPAARAAVEPLPDFTQLGRGRAPADARRPPQDGRAPERARGRRSRTSRSTTTPTSPALEELRKQLREAGRGGRRQPDRDGDRGQGRRRRAARCSRSSTRRSTWPPTRSSTRSTCNIGVAVDTDRGLLVPVIRDADQKNITQLSVELAQLSEKARDPQDRARRDAGRLLQHLESRRHRRHRRSRRSSTRRKSRSSASRARAWSRSTTRRPASSCRGCMLPLSLSYDHRVIDGADGIRFLRWVAEALEQPFLLALHGLDRADGWARPSCLRGTVS